MVTISTFVIHRFCKINNRAEKRIRLFRFSALVFQNAGLIENAFSIIPKNTFPKKNGNTYAELRIDT